MTTFRFFNSRWIHVISIFGTLTLSNCLEVWRFLKVNDTFPPSVREWQSLIAPSSGKKRELKEFVDKKHNYVLDGLSFSRFLSSSQSSQQTSSSNIFSFLSILSVSVRRGDNSNWYIPSRHEKNGFGWNRSVSKGFLDFPLACTIQFYAIAFEDNIKSYIHGGGGYIQFNFEVDKNKKVWIGYDQNITNRIHCYFSTTKDTGSEFLDNPKTLGIAISCPISMDMEIGDFIHRHPMLPGNVCRNILEYETNLDMVFNSDQSKLFSNPQNHIVSENNVINPVAFRTEFLDHYYKVNSHLHLNAVCTVQTFRNPQSGPMLYLFVYYYLSLGWQVIVYDRFGYHKDYISEFLSPSSSSSSSSGYQYHNGFHYHPYTVMQLTQPNKYNQQYADAQESEFKYFYKMEKNWGYTAKKQADTSDQDQDKTRTYDFCRVEYDHIHTVLFVDSDEFLFCPEMSTNVNSQKDYQQHIMDNFYRLGIEEMRFARIPYSGFIHVENYNSSITDQEMSNLSYKCMTQAYSEKSPIKMFQCWSNASSYDDFPKSADMASRCPFHYNHWSCDGMRGGGRDHTTKRCRCKVAFDLMNHLEYKPFPDRCHLAHLNDNKYRFQSRRNKKNGDRGNITEYNGIVSMLVNDITNNETTFNPSKIPKYVSSVSSSMSLNHKKSNHGKRHNLNKQMG